MGKAVVVPLTWREMRLAGGQGVERIVMDLYEGRRDRYGAPTHPWQSDMQGAVAELAVAKLRNRYPPFGDPELYRHGDVDGLQVRSTHYPSGCLIVHQDDPDDAPFVCVIVPRQTSRPKTRALSVLVVGWIMGRDAKQSEWWRTTDDDDRLHSAGYWVPQSALLPWSELPDD